MSDQATLTAEAPMTRTYRVAVVYGGRSSEREVSLATGRAVGQALEARGHQVTMIDPRDPQAPERHLDLLDAIERAGAEVVFNALHGTYGEDGCLQGLLDWSGVPYTGSGLKSSAVAMDKEMTRQLWRVAGVPVAEGWVWRAGEPLPQAELLPSGPWALKPLAEGSSVGISRCDELEELHAKLRELKSGSWLIEAWLEGCELSVVVFEGEAWGGVEIVPSRGWYDYEAKYVRGDTQYFCPPRLSDERLSEIYALAERAYLALECEGVARVDFISADSKLIALELNTSPGMTATSLVPKVAQARGLSFEELTEQLVTAALSARDSLGGRDD